MRHEKTTPQTTEKIARTYDKTNVGTHWVKEKRMKVEWIEVKCEKEKNNTLQPSKQQLKESAEGIRML